MVIPGALINLIKQFEGLSLTRYNDVAGFATIGYGHLIKPQETNLNAISEEKALDLLLNDVAIHFKAVNRLITAPLNQNQLCALVDFSFNLGSGALQRSTLRAKLNRGDYCHAAEEFVRYRYAGGKVIAGLLRRRLAERDLFLS